MKKMDNTDELISVIIPVYNKEAYLEECIQSLLDQTYKNIEVILIDDGSTDRSAEICQSFCNQDTRVKSFFQENAGQNAARRNGISKATANWVSFVDADDFVSSDFCLRLIKEQVTSGVDCVMGQSQKYQNGNFGTVSGILDGIYSGAEAVMRFIDKEFFSFNMPSGMLPILFQKKVVEEALNVIDLRITFSEDCGCALYVLLRVHKVRILSDVVYYYRQVPKSYCHMHDKSNVLSQKFLMNFLYKTFLASHMSNAANRIIDWLIIRDLLLGGYDFFSDYNGIFPFIEDVSSGQIALYGAGVFGEEMYSKLNQNFKMVGWFDREFQYYQELGRAVWNPKRLLDCEYDWLVIAIMNPRTVKKIVAGLKNMGIDAAKMLTISPAIIESNYTKYKLKELRCVDENYSYVSAPVLSRQGK